MTEENPDWSVSELAEQLNVSMGTVRRWIREGQLEAYSTPGGQWRVTDEAVREIRSAGDQVS